MAFPTEVNTNINLAKAYFSSLVEDYQNDLYIGGCTCDKGTMYVLDSLLTALLYKQEEDNFDTTAQNLYEKLIGLAGLSEATAVLTGFFGYKSDNSILNTAQIQAGTSFSYYNGTDVTVNFNSSSFNYLWFAIRSDQSDKTSYVDANDPDNAGSIGTSGDFMNAPTVVAGDITYDFYITNYKTTQTTPLIFKS